MTLTQTTAAQAERSLIGAVILESRILQWLEFDPRDYAEPLYESLHMAAQALRDAGQPADAITIPERAARLHSGPVDPTIGHRLAADVPSATSAGYYAELVTREALRRRIRGAAGTLNQLVDEADPDTALEEAQAELDRIKNQAGHQSVKFIGDTLDETIDSLSQPPQYVPTPWSSLNQLIGGYRPGAMYVIGARPASGKSIYALQSAIGLAEYGSVAFISLEMSTYDLQKRAISNVAKVDGMRLQNHELSEWDWDQIASHREKLMSLPIAIMDQAATIQQMRRFITSTHRRKPLAGIVLDYLQILDPPAGDKRNKNEYVAAMSRSLKLLAMELQVPVIVLSQLNRNSTSRSDGLPVLSDLRDSGAIEQDADAVVLLHRDPDPEKSHEIKMLVAKNRRGGTGAKTFDFKGYRSIISEHGEAI